MLFFSIGTKYGTFNIKSIVQSANTISGHVHFLANEYHSGLEEILKELYDTKLFAII